MTPAAIIREAKAEGVTLTLSPAGSIKATGDARVVDRWVPVIRQHKPEIAALLVDAANDVPIPDDLDRLIRLAGTIYEYPPEDFDLVRGLARSDPGGLRRVFEGDPLVRLALLRLGIPEVGGDRK